MGSWSYGAGQSSPHVALARAPYTGCGERTERQLRDSKPAAWNLPGDPRALLSEAAVTGCGVK